MQLKAHVPRGLIRKVCIFKRSKGCVSVNGFRFNIGLGLLALVRQLYIGLVASYIWFRFLFGIASSVSGLYSIGCVSVRFRYISIGHTSCYM